jgi:hypothetical protein
MNIGLVERWMLFLETGRKHRRNFGRSYALPLSFVVEIQHDF